MSMFKDKGKKEMPGITSSSLSDIVFMLLFFFMVTTQLRETENKVMVKIPNASESVKLERKDLASYINVGTPIKSLQRASMVPTPVSSSTIPSVPLRKSRTSLQLSVTPRVKQTVPS